MTSLKSLISLISVRVGLTSLLLMMHALCAIADDDVKLSGTVIGTTQSVDYATSKQSTTVNTRDMAFDGNLNTFFASWDRSYTWTGLDLGTPHVITRVGWSPRNDSQGGKRVVLGVFEGANREDFMDALPLYIIKRKCHYIVQINRLLFEPSVIHLNHYLMHHYSLIALKIPILLCLHPQVL